MGLPSPFVGSLTSTLPPFCGLSMLIGELGRGSSTPTVLGGELCVGLTNEDEVEVVDTCVDIVDFEAS